MKNHGALPPALRCCRSLAIPFPSNGVEMLYNPLRNPNSLLLHPEGPTVVL